MSTLSLPSDTPEEGIDSHYRWLWATVWLLGIELRTSGRAVSALNSWIICKTGFLRVVLASLELTLFPGWSQIYRDLTTSLSSAGVNVEPPLPGKFCLAGVGDWVLNIVFLFLFFFFFFFFWCVCVFGRIYFSACRASGIFLLLLFGFCFFLRQGFSV